MKNEIVKEVAEYMLLKDLITKIYPTGICSVVSDTFDFWRLVTRILPTLKEEIMNRDGKLVIRPDSGDPVRIICGYEKSEIKNKDGEYYCLETNKLLHEYEVKGLIQCLWDIFGGTKTYLGYKVLDNHIGAIYGDSITYIRAVQILERLKRKGFASTNIVLGIGSYTFQLTTRDVHGFAMKSTYTVVDGKGFEIFKDPKTDDGTKKSAKGLLRVDWDLGKLVLTDQCTEEEEKGGLLEPVFLDGKLLRTTTLAEIRNNVAGFDK